MASSKLCSMRDMNVTKVVLVVVLYYSILFNEKDPV